MKPLLTIGLLVLSNAFMTLAWYGHLKFKEMAWFSKLGIFSVILISWVLHSLSIASRCLPTVSGSGKMAAPFL